MEHKIREFRSALDRYEKYKALSDAAEMDMIADLEDERKEVVFDNYYREEFKHWQACVSLLKQLIGCSEDIAKRMIAIERDKIKALLAQVAL